MDDFFKTKVGFTIGLLAAVFAFKPLVDANSDLGFSLFIIKVTIENAYLFLTSFLGLAVYFISLQFASNKHLALLDRVSDTCYSIALVTPPAFLILWIVISSLNYISNFISLIPSGAINFIAGALTSIFSAYMYFFLKKSIREKFVAEEKTKEHKENIKILSRAQELLKSGMYDMSVLESSKVLEATLTSLLLAKGVDVENVSMYKLITLAETNSILNSLEIKMLNEVRVKRNDSVHAVDAIDEETAKRILQLSRELILRLDSISSSSAFKWLEKNRAKAIKLLKDGNYSKSEHVIKMLAEASKNRDGAAWLEMSEFFEVALVNSSHLIVDMFSDEKELFESWLDSAEILLFYDFSGGDNMDHLASIKREIILNLDKYIATESDLSKLTVAERILTVIESSEVTGIQ